MDGEVELQVLLDELNETLHGVDDDPLDMGWEVYLSLPLGVRDYLLSLLPAWWTLPGPAARRLLIAAAGLIVWHGMAPREAVRLAGRRLRLPPPRATALPPRRAPARRTAARAMPIMPPRRPPPIARRGVPAPRPRLGVTAPQRVRPLPRMARVRRPPPMRRLGGFRRIRGR